MIARAFLDRQATFMVCLLGAFTVMIGLLACPLASLWLQRGFVFLSAVTFLSALAIFIWHWSRKAPHQRVLALGYGNIPLVCIWAFLLWECSMRGSIRETNGRTQMHNNGKNIGLAIDSFDDANKHLPFDIHDANNGPLLSWRVSICPYLDQPALYAQFNLKQAWDSPHNGPFVEKMPYPYASILFEQAPGHTPWQGFVGPGTAFEPGRKLKLASDFPDGAGNTILFVEANQHVPWSKPADIPYGPGIPLPALGQDYLAQGAWPFCCPVHTTPRYLVCMGDCTVRMFSSATPEAVLRALIVRNDGEPDRGWLLDH